MTVRDTSTGMDEKTMERIFEPFFTTKGLSKGTGLGLASVYGLVKSHGGYIDVDSKKGEGATFNIYLPASQEEVSDKEVCPEKIEEGNETLLLVDDEAMLLEVADEILKMMGYTVYTAGGGKEAMEIFKAHHDIESQASEILDRGCNGFIQKPFELADLSRKLRDILDKG